MDCPTCGAENSESADFCTLCLARFPRADEGPAPNADEPSEPAENAAAPDVGEAPELSTAVYFAESGSTGTFRALSADEQAHRLNVPLAGPPPSAKVPSWAQPKYRDACDALVRGNTLMRQGDPAGAVRKYESALTLFERVFGMDASELEHVYENLFQAYEALDDGDNAMRALGHLLAVSAQAHGASSLHTAPALQRIGRAELERGAYEDAEKHLCRALEIFSAELGATSRPAIIAELDVTTVQLALGRYDEAEEILRTSIAALEARGDTGPQLAMRLDNLAGICAARMRFEEADALRKRAERLREGGATPESGETEADEADAGGGAGDDPWPETDA